MSREAGTFLMHYAVENVQVGVARVAIFAFRCGDCSDDFHIDHRPNFCPKCGTPWTKERTFGIFGGVRDQEDAA
jgi:rRNA maturation endonuclease Nob1